MNVSFKLTFFVQIFNFHTDKLVAVAWNFQIGCEAAIPPLIHHGKIYPHKTNEC